MDHVLQVKAKDVGAGRHERYRPDIDGLRAVAVLAVVVFHAFPAVVPSGFYGVDVFFVISGYLIGGIILRQIEQGRLDLANFYARRVRRLFPALLVVLVAALLVGWFVLLPEEYASLGRHVLAASTFVSNFLLWSETGYFAATIDQKPLMHLWSLGVEEQFYILWPALLFVSARFFRSVAAGIAIVGLLSFASLALTPNVSDAASFYLPIYRFWELALGSLLAASERAAGGYPRSLARLPPRPLKDGLALLGLTAVLGAMFLPASVRAASGLWAIIPTLGTLLVIACGPSCWVQRRLLGNGVSTWIGRISYPLYLWHWPLLSFAYIVDMDAPSPTILVAAVGASVLLAALTYVFVETPVRTGNRGRGTVAGLSLAMIAVGGAGLVTALRDGYLGRMPEFLRSVTSPADYKAYLAEARFGRCWFVEGQANTGFADDCIDTSRRPSLFLWGDSYSAAFYIGFRHQLAGMGHGLSQVSGCPPIIGYDKPGWTHCPALTRYAIDAIARTKPDTVVLAADWTVHELEGLQESIAELKRLGIENIVLLGPTPHWHISLPRVMLSYMLDHGGRMPPDRLGEGLVALSTILDGELRDIADAQHIKYIPIYDALCDQEGCLVWAGGRRGDLIARDASHLTPAGSVYAVGLILDAVLQRRPGP